MLRLILIVTVLFGISDEKPAVNLTSPMESIVESDQGSQNRTPITILASVNYDGSIASGPLCTKATELALDRLNKIPPWNTKYKLNVELFNDRCSNEVAIQSFAEKLSHPKAEGHRFPLVMINDCAGAGAVVASQMVKFYDHVGVLWSIKDDNPFDKHRYSSSLALVPHMTIPYSSTLDFMVEQGWKKIAVFSENYAYFNFVEQFLFKLFDERNMTVTGMAKVAAGTNDTEEMEQAVDELKRKDPRILFANTDHPANLWCWLHKFGLYGPGHIIVGSVWSKIDPDTVKIPDYISSWCTNSMLQDVAPSAIYFGYGAMRDIMPNSTDSTGLSGSEFMEIMKQKVVHPEKSPAWNVWPWLCYDVALFTGYVIGKAEYFLNHMHNTTLSEWLVGSPKYRQNYRTVLRALKRAACTVRVTGLQGEYLFSPKTHGNTNGFIPVIFSELRQADSHFHSAITSYYKSNAKRTFYLNGGPSWRTYDGNPPPDSIRYVSLEAPPNAFERYTIISVIAAITTVYAIAMLILLVVADKIPPRWQGGFVKNELVGDACLVAGHILMISHFFATPLSPNAHEMIASCSALFFLLMIGYALSGIATWSKLRKGVWIISVAQQEDGRRGKLAKQTNVVMLAWFCLHLILLLVLASLGAFGVTNRPLAPYYSEELSTMFEPYQPECVLKMGNLGLPMAIACLHGLLLLLTCFETYKLQARMKDASIRYNFRSDRITFSSLGLLATSVYCKTLVTLATIIIVLIQVSNKAFVSTVIASAIVIYVLLDLTIVYLTKLFPNCYTPPVQTISGAKGTTHPSASRGKTGKRTTSKATSPQKTK